VRRNKIWSTICGAALAASCFAPQAEAVVATPDGVVVNDAIDSGVVLGGLDERAGVMVGEDIVLMEETPMEFEKPELDLPKELRMKVNGFRITGQELFAEEKLTALLDDKKGQLLTFGDLQDLSDRLTNFFRKEGYIATRVYIPAQKIYNGIVEYTVVVGKYDGVTYDNKSHIADAQIRRQIAFLKKGEYVTKKKLERAVWLLTDLSGADAKATLTTGQGDGTVHLHLDIRSYIGGQQGMLYADNYGNRYTGYNEYGLTYDLLNLAHQGDHLAFNVMTTGNLLTNGTAMYTLPMAKDGLNFNVGYSQVSYDLGKEYTRLRGTGVARIWRTGLDYAIRRSQMNNMYVGLEYEHSRVNDAYRIDPSYDRYNDKMGNAAVLSLYGNEQDKHGASNWRVEYKYGNLHFNNAMTYRMDADTHTVGNYSKFKVQYIRRQDLNRRAYLMLVARGQLASKNLDSYDHLSIGGISGVRAYPQGEGSGDSGVLLRAEHRWKLPLRSKHQTFHFVNTFDYGAVKINKDNSHIGLQNHRSLYSTGVGMIWQCPNEWFVRADYAWRLSSEKPHSDIPGHYDNGHFWLQAGMYF